MTETLDQAQCIAMRYGRQGNVNELTDYVESLVGWAVDFLVDLSRCIAVTAGFGVEDSAKLFAIAAFTADGRLRDGWPYSILMLWN